MTARSWRPWGQPAIRRKRLAKLIETGVDCFRLNFSHGAKEDHARRLDAIRTAERVAGRPVGVFADLQGPKIRVGKFVDGQITLRYGEIVTLEASKEAGEPGILRLPHPEIVDTLETGDILKLDDGKMQITVTERVGKNLKARVDFGGELKNQKGLNVPTRRIPISALTDKDREDLVYALELGVDYIALSFVQHGDDVREARALIGDKAGIISKIEKPSALEHIHEIVDLSDAVMVARGDLGVELPPEQVPIAQRAHHPRGARGGPPGDRGDAHAGKHGRRADADARGSVRRGDRGLSRARTR